MSPFTASKTQFKINKNASTTKCLYDVYANILSCICMYIKVPEEMIVIKDNMPGYYVRDEFTKKKTINYKY